MLCGYCNIVTGQIECAGHGIEPPVMLCGHCNGARDEILAAVIPIEPPVMLCGYCNYLWKPAVPGGYGY